MKTVTAIAFPLVLLVLLQLGGCTGSGGTPAAGGVYRSESAGANFDQSVKIEGQGNANVSRFSMRRAYRLPKEPQKIYVTAGDNGLIFSDNNGRSWHLIDVPLAATLDIVALDNKLLLVSGTGKDGQGYVLRSLDKGLSWETVLTVPVPVNTGRFEIIKQKVTPTVTISLERDPFNNTRVYAGTNLGTILAGEQSGKTWRTVHTLKSSIGQTFSSAETLGIRKLIASPHKNNEILLLTINGTLIKLNGTEQSVITIPKNLGEKSVFDVADQSRWVVDASYIRDFPNALLAATREGAAITRDYGKTWIELKLPITSASPFNNATAQVSPTNSKRMLIAFNEVLYRSEDGGVSWNTFSFNLPQHMIVELLIDPSNAANVLAILQPVKT